MNGAKVLSPTQLFLNRLSSRFATSSSAGERQPLRAERNRAVASSTVAADGKEEKKQQQASQKLAANTTTVFDEIPSDLDPRQQQNLRSIQSWLIENDNSRK
jgi:hypothetical protein